MIKKSTRKTYILMAPVLAIMLLLILASTSHAADDVWTANYWNNKDLSGTPVLTRYEQSINYDWGHGSPDPVVNDDNFSARWERRVFFNEGTYRFDATMDDAMRIWIDTQIIIDSWTDSQEHTMSRDVYMVQGEYNIQVDYYEAGGVAIAKVGWHQISGPISSGGSGGGYGGGGGAYYPNWKGEYFNNKNLSGNPSLIRDDRYLSFDWGEGSPDPVINNNNFSARWTRIINTNPGYYRLVLTSDDGSRLYVNGLLLIDNWNVQSPTTKVADYYYPGGPIELRVEYFENRGTASVNLGVGIVPPGG